MPRPAAPPRPAPPRPLWSSAQVDDDGRVFVRSAAAAEGAEAGRLVDLGGGLGPEGGSRLAALLLAAPPPKLTELILRCFSATKPRHSAVPESCQ